jgi:hypothetical protein
MRYLFAENFAMMIAAESWAATGQPLSALNPSREVLKIFFSLRQGCPMILFQIFFTSFYNRCKT